MTPQEAIERIKEHTEIHFKKEKGRCPLITEALNMAVNALEKQTPKKPKHIYEEHKKHKWKKRSDGAIDDFAWGADVHNGPVCERCGETPCMFCEPDYDKEKCIINEWRCPVCDRLVSRYSDKKFCNCGQALDWSGCNE